jgi:hypothetical protein
VTQNPSPCAQGRVPGALWAWRGGGWGEGSWEEGTGVRASAPSIRINSIDARQRLIQILDQIGYVFDPGRETHQTVADAGGRPLLG